MIRGPRRVAALAALVAVAASGCGLGPGGSSEGEATLTVTRGYGSQRLLEATDSDPTASQTVIGLLDSEAELSTRYGGAFVHSIEGIEGTVSDGRSLDWFFFVNGVESSVGGAEVGVSAGDRIWWDYRDWTDALRTPAVVGSWPEPFAQASAGEEALPVRVACHTDEALCEATGERLAEAGVEARVVDGDGADDPALVVLVGPWRELRAEPVAAQLDDGPATSGVFARFRSAGGAYELVAMNDRAEAVDDFGPGTGLVAALRDGEEPPAWLITGTDEAGVERAVELLDAEDLGDRYAVLASADTELALPVGESG